jgi:hypothetical protein
MDEVATQKIAENQDITKTLAPSESRGLKLCSALEIKCFIKRLSTWEK